MAYNERDTWIIREKKSKKVIGKYRTSAYALVELKKMKNENLEMVKIKKIKYTGKGRIN